MNIQLIQQHLERLNLKPEAGEGGVIVFKYEGCSFVVTTEADDAEFIQFMVPNIWPLQNAESRERAYRVVNDINKKIKVAKLYVHDDDDVHACVESFLPDEAVCAAVIELYIGVLHATVRYFQKAMQEGEAAASPDSTERSST